MAATAGDQAAAVGGVGRGVAVAGGAGCGGAGGGLHSPRRGGGGGGGVVNIVAGGSMLIRGTIEANGGPGGVGAGQSIDPAGGPARTTGHALAAAGGLTAEQAACDYFDDDEYFVHLFTSGQTEALMLNTTARST
mgnify:CR=1 FL=1